MNARERCRARRHANRCDERMIARATGAKVNSSSGSVCLPQVAIYSAGHRKSESVTAR